jgi:hypothetical protein
MTTSSSIFGVVTILVTLLLLLLLGTNVDPVNGQGTTTAGIGSAGDDGRVNTVATSSAAVDGTTMTTGDITKRHHERLLGQIMSTKVEKKRLTTTKPNSARGLQTSSSSSSTLSSSSLPGTNVDFSEFHNIHNRLRRRRSNKMNFSSEGSSKKKNKGGSINNKKKNGGMPCDVEVRVPNEIERT